jgi:integrase/recombinase XerD
MGPLRFELKSLAPQAIRLPEVTGVTQETLRQYLNIITIEGICSEWLYTIDRCILIPYLNYSKWQIDLDTTLEYLLQLKDKHSISYYRKHLLQIRKFLQYLEVDWAKKLNAPTETQYTPKRISEDDIAKTLHFFEGKRYYLQCKSLILLGASSGARSEEMYQLTIKDINLEERIININHDPRRNQTTKTKQSRVSFFTQGAKDVLQEYLAFYKESRLTYLYAQSHITRLFRGAPIQVKDLRKYFSQTWDRLSGPTSVKKVLMGHSMRTDVDLQHYDAQSKEDLKKIYDKVMGGVRE